MTTYRPPILTESDKEHALQLLGNMFADHVIMKAWPRVKMALEVAHAMQLAVPNAYWYVASHPRYGWEVHKRQSELRRGEQECLTDAA